jgi:hypothetical protein
MISAQTLQYSDCRYTCKLTKKCCYIRDPFEKFVDWRQCAAVMQMEAVIIMPSCGGGGNVVVA